MIAPRSVDITPDKSLIEKLGSVGFSPEEAIAEFIDNSIDALYDSRTGKRIVKGPARIEVSLTATEILISDTSAGISDFDNCMKAAWSEKSGVRLGQFGLGMKTASMSLGRLVDIHSKRIGECVEHSTTLDLDEWYKTDSWRIDVQDTTAEPSDHYTRIRIAKLLVDPLLYSVELRGELAERFGPLILDNEVVVTINGSTIQPEPIRFLPENDPSYKRVLEESGPKSFKKRLDFSFQVEGYKITGWIDILERRSLSGRFGFHIFRGRRLIQPFVKVGIRDHPNNANLFGQLYLPYDFPVAFTKNRIEWRGRASLVADLEQICADHRRVALKMASEKAPVVHPKIVADVKRSLDILADAVRESPFVRDLAESEAKRALASSANGYGPVDSEKRAPRLNKSATRPIPKNVRARNPVPGQPRQKKDFWLIRVGQFQLKLSHEWTETDEPRMWYSTFLESRTPPELLVQTNVAFDAFEATSDKMYYATGTVIMALSRVLRDLSTQAGRASPDLVDLQEDLYLRWGAKIRLGFARGASTIRRGS
jgi:hypothetical protein